MRTNLSPAFVDRAEAEPDADRTIYWDEALRGFGLQVTRAGHKSYVVQYRANGQSRRLALKAALKLGEARKEAKGILGRVAKGGDPLAERRKVSAAAENTLEKISEAYFKREKKRLRTMDERERVLKRLVFPKLGNRQIEDIKRTEIVRLLDKIEDDSGAVMADRTLAYLRRVMTWYAGRSDDFRSPIVRGMARTKPAELARDRVLTDDEIMAVWKAAGEMQNAFGPYIKFLLLTAARKTEASHMTRDEISGNVWTIPAARDKGKVDQVKPLSKAAKSVIEAIPVIGKGKFVFTHDGATPIGGFSKFKEALDKASGVTGWRIHDLRRTARSLMSRAGVPADIAERVLGHVINGVRGVYDRHEYLDEKRAALDALAKEVGRITAKKKDKAA
jgi:integrase